MRIDTTNKDVIEYYRLNPIDMFPIDLCDRCAGEWVDVTELEIDHPEYNNEDTCFECNGLLVIQEREHIMNEVYKVQEYHELNNRWLDVCHEVSRPVANQIFKDHISNSDSLKFRIICIEVIEHVVEQSRFRSNQKPLEKN